MPLLSYRDAFPKNALRIVIDSSSSVARFRGLRRFANPFVDITVAEIQCRNFTGFRDVLLKYSYIPILLHIFPYVNAKINRRPRFQKTSLLRLPL